MLSNYDTTIVLSPDEAELARERERRGAALCFLRRHLKRARNAGASPLHEAREALSALEAALELLVLGAPLRRGVAARLATLTKYIERASRKR